MDGTRDPGGGGTGGGSTGGGSGDAGTSDHDAPRSRVGKLAHRPSMPGRPTLNSAVRRRRADRAFYIRLAGILRQNEGALRRLQR